MKIKKFGTGEEVEASPFMSVDHLVDSLNYWSEGVDAATSSEEYLLCLEGLHQCATDLVMETARIKTKIIMEIKE